MFILKCLFCFFINEIKMKFIDNVIYIKKMFSVEYTQKEENAQGNPCEPVQTVKCSRKIIFDLKRVVAKLLAHSCSFCWLHHWSNITMTAWEGNYSPRNRNKCTNVECWNIWKNKLHVLEGSYSNLNTVN